jgi:hypothetical protein
MAASAPLEAPRADPDAEGRAARDDTADRAAVSLAYETPALGRLDVRMDRGPEGVVVSIGVPAQTYALAGARAEALRQALEERTGAPAVVRIVPRREPFDAYA